MTKFILCYLPVNVEDEIFFAEGTLNEMKTAFDAAIKSMTDSRTKWFIYEWSDNVGQLRKLVLNTEGRWW